METQTRRPIATSDRRTRIPRLLPLVLGAALALGGCGEDDARSSERRPIGGPPAGMQGGAQSRDLPREVTVPLDSGNMAYRQGDYEAAADYFRAAAQADPAGKSAGWFGVYMAQQAMGNEAAAESALSKAGDLSGTAGVHPTAGAADSAASGGWQHPDTTGAGGGWQHPDTTGTGGVWTHPDTTGGRGR